MNYSKFMKQILAEEKKKKVKFRNLYENGYDPGEEYKKRYKNSWIDCVWYLDPSGPKKPRYM